MFGDLDLAEVDPEQLESETTKILRQEAAKAEEMAAVAIHGPILADLITRVPITMASLPAKFGIPPESLPETESVKEVSSKNPTKRVTKFYYTCKICQHSSQNKVSMLTHTCRCLKIKLFCKFATKCMSQLIMLRNILMSCSEEFQGISFFYYYNYETQELTKMFTCSVQINAALIVPFT